MPIIQESCGRFSITIPDAIIKLYGWRKGDVLEFFEERPGVMAVRKVR